MRRLKNPRRSPGVFDWRLIKHRFKPPHDDFFFFFFFFFLRHHLADLVYLEHLVTVPLAGRPTNLAAASTISLGLA